MRSIIVFSLVVSTAIVSVMALTGCKEEDELLKNPQTKDIGTFEGCDVKYVDRGYQSKSFYLAKCPGNKTSHTTTWLETQQKSLVNRQNIAVTDDVQCDTPEQAKAKAEDAAKSAAIAKLTPVERKLLGLP